MVPQKWSKCIESPIEMKSQIFGWLFVHLQKTKKKPSDCRELHIKSTFKLMHIPFHLNNPYCRSVVVLTVFSLNQTEPELKAIALKCLALLWASRKESKQYFMFLLLWFLGSYHKVGKKHWKFYLFGLSIRLLQFFQTMFAARFDQAQLNKCINKLDLLHVQLHWWEK